MAKKSASKKRVITPLGDRVLVEESKEETKTASGIILPDDYSEDKGMKEGKVVSVGEGKMEHGKLVKPSVKKGDKILFQWGDEVKIDGKDYYLVNDSSIAAIIN